MNICLIGKNISNLLLAKTLDNQGIYFDLFYSDKNNLSKMETRTIGITEDNINFISSNIKNLKNYSWNIDNIKIYTESDINYETLNFNSEKKFHFSIIKYSNLYKLLERNLKKCKNFKTFFVSKKKINQIMQNKKYDLIINSDFKNQISKKYFYQKYSKNYNSTAYTTIINHKLCKNKSATQIFTKFGPLAFLPISKKKTSLVFSIENKYSDVNFNNVSKLIKHYKKAVEHYNNNNVVGLFDLADELDIKLPEIDESHIEVMESTIESLKVKIERYKKSNAWVWHHASGEVAEDILNQIVNKL